MWRLLRFRVYDEQHQVPIQMRWMNPEERQLVDKKVDPVYTFLPFNSERAGEEKVAKAKIATSRKRVVSKRESDQPDRRALALTQRNTLPHQGLPCCLCYQELLKSQLSLRA